MLLFNNQHIFTGYIKQLLSEFNLPKYYKHSWPITKKVGYFYNKKVPNYTKNLEVRSNIYDTYTHEYLGEYLRFQRDYNNLDLMPLYNCFSNNLCTNLKINGENFTFNTLEQEYKIYMVPVKFGKEYTIAIDSSMKVECCCGFYNTYYYKNSDNDIIETTTYKVFRNMTFNSPELIKIVEPPSLNLEESAQLNFIYDHEQDLKLFIKLPANNSSSIVILEGNYTQFNDSSTTAEGSKYNIKTNNYVINMRPVIDGKEQDYQEDQPFVPITRLQLLTMNTGISYPFSDKLIEYLTGMAITSEDEIIDNILRAQEVMKLKKVATGYDSLYTQLTSLQSTGTQYIDTGVKISSKVSIEIAFSFDDTSSTESYVFGTDINPYYCTIGRLNNGRFRAMNTSELSYEAGNIDTDVHTVKMSATRIIFDSIIENGACTPYEDENNRNFFLFAANIGNYAAYHFTGHIYYCKMWKELENGALQLIRDFIPVRYNNGVLGLYDLVSKTLFTNKGSGSFIAGTPVKTEPPKEITKYITFDVDGAWSNKMRALIYSNSFTGSVGNGKEGSLNTFAYNNDNLGYIDKTAETYYKGKIKDKTVSIENIDIYPNIYKDSKGE